MTPLDLQGRAPKEYILAPPGSGKKAGRYGEGIGGEALVCLLPDDSGDWFRALCTEKDPSGSVQYHEAEEA